MVQVTLTLKMTAAQVVETSVTVNNSPIQDYTLTEMIMLNPLIVQVLGCLASLMLIFTCL